MKDLVKLKNYWHVMSILEIQADSYWMCDFAYIHVYVYMCMRLYIYIYSIYMCVYIYSVLGITGFKYHFIELFCYNIDEMP